MHDFAAQLDTISSLKDVNAIVLLVKISFSFITHGGIFVLDMLMPLCNEEFCKVRRLSTHDKAINLLTDQHLISICCARVDVLFIGGILKSHLVDEDLSSHRMPASGCP